MRKLSFVLLFHFFLIPVCNSQSCVNWLNTPSFPSSVSAGDLDVTGNQLTVEANFNSIAQSSNGSWGHIVSKHTTTTDVNYALSSNAAEITTSTGYKVVFETCPIQLNKTYHTALVYDGATLKFYRNGFLLNQIPCTGNLVTNDLLTTISQVAGASVSGEQFTGYVNEVRIWNVARTQAQLQTYMSSSLPNPTTQTGLLGYYTFENLLNKQGNAAFNGTINGPAIINTTNPNCTFIADSCSIICTPSYDFSYQQSVCNPLSVQFFSAGSNPINPYWSFGDGNINLSNSTPTNSYPAYGNYTIKYHIDNANCPDTITKVISLQVSNADIILTPDTTICFGATKLLRAQPSPNFCWSPATYLNNPLLNNPTTSTPTNITYYYTAEILGNNLIPNGDFSSGNTGFTSDYNYQTSNSIANAVYGVATNAQTWNGGASPCLDHTSGTGNMLVANGATVPGKKIWKSSFSVTPNTSYQFSAWIESISLANFAVFKFYINGVPFGPTLNAPPAACQWVQQKLNWNSGNNTTVDLSLEDFTYDADGNDFALDDISFNSVTIKRDSVKITVDTPKIAVLGTTIVCTGVATQLSATGGSTYVWTPATGLSNANIANPIATALSNTIYTVTGTTTKGCTAQASVTITIKPKPVITKSNDTSICKNTSVQLLATGGTSYTWTPAATLNNPNIATPIATPTAAVTKYYVTVINNNVNTCPNRDSVKVTIRLDPVFTVSPAQVTCKGTMAQLNASGGNIYLWSPAGLVSNAAIANPIATADATASYSVTITESICNISQTLSTLVTVNPVPVVTASKSNDIDCSIEFASLSATGAVQYTWTPTTGLDNSTIATPVARPTATTQYVVKGSNVFGCYDSDTLTVAVTMIGRSPYLMANTFTPDGDGKNDCFGIKYWGIIEQLEFTIYNRYGERVFYTTDPYQCWNGLYKSDKPLPGNYVYYIKAKTACGSVERKGNVLLLR